MFGRHFTRKVKYSLFFGEVSTKKLFIYNIQIFHIYSFTNQIKRKFMRLFDKFLVITFEFFRMYLLKTNDIWKFQKVVF